MTLSPETIMRISQKAAAITCARWPSIIADVAQDVALETWIRDQQGKRTNVYHKARESRRWYVNYCWGERIREVQWESAADNPNTPWTYIGQDPGTFRRVAGFWQFEKAWGKLTITQQTALIDKLVGYASNENSNATHRALSTVINYPSTYHQMRKIKKELDSKSQAWHIY